MKYRKPEVVDLGVRMKHAAGQNVPNTCVTGGSAYSWEACKTGTGGDETACRGGNAPGGFSSCVSGTSVGYYCEAGSSGMDDPYGCRTGPSVT